MNALILVDLQNDFVPGGALAVPNGDQVIPVANKLQDKFDLVVATQDWHPADHGSFAANHPGHKVGDVIDLNGVEQILWPVHCVQETRGAQFVPGLKTDRFDRIFRKGIDPAIDSYSTFFDNARRRSTGLIDYLKQKDVRAIYIMGLATDYCVLFSVLDARELGLNVFVIADGCRGVDLKPGDSDRAVERMRQAGAMIVRSDEL